MKRLIVALLVATLCMVAPVVALDWGDVPVTQDVKIIKTHTCNSYLDVTIVEEGITYAGWCVDSSKNVNTKQYSAEFSSTIGVSAEYNKINWVLNHKGNANYKEIQVAISKILGQKTPRGLSNNAVSKKLVRDADPEFVPTCGEIGAVLVMQQVMSNNNGNCNYNCGCKIGQPVIIEIEIPCPPEPTPTPTPVPEFPAMMIPVFLVGSLLVVASVLKKE